MASSTSSAAGMRKRAHKTLTIDQKLELLDQIGKISYTVFCEKYSIGCSTITDINKRESSLRQYKRKMTDMGVKRPAKTMKLGKDEEIEMALHLSGDQYGSSRVVNLVEFVASRVNC